MRPVISSVLFSGVVVLPMLLLGCGFMSSVNEIYGHYSLRKQEATVELDLKRDMTFVETIRFSTGEVVALEGKWRFSVIDNEGDVDLDGAAQLSKTLSPQEVRRIDTSMEAQKWFWKIRLCADANADLYFVRDASK